MHPIPHVRSKRGLEWYDLASQALFIVDPASPSMYSLREIICSHTRMGITFDMELVVMVAFSFEGLHYVVCSLDPFASLEMMEMGSLKSPFLSTRMYYMYTC